MNITLSDTLCAVYHTRLSGAHDDGRCSIKRTPFFFHHQPFITPPDLLIGWKSDGKCEHGHEDDRDIPFSIIHFLFTFSSLGKEEPTFGFLVVIGEPQVCGMPEHLFVIHRIPRRLRPCKF